MICASRFFNQMLFGKTGNRKIINRFLKIELIHHQRYETRGCALTEEWLKDTLEKLPTWPNSRIDELLPLTPAMIEKLK